MENSRPARAVMGAIIGYIVSCASSLAWFLVMRRPPHEQQPGWFIALTAIYGIILSVISGYIAARIGGYKSGFAVAVIIFVAALLSAVFSPPPHWSQIVALVAMSPFAVLGARLGRAGGF